MRGLERCADGRVGTDIAPSSTASFGRHRYGFPLFLQLLDRPQYPAHSSSRPSDVRLIGAARTATARSQRPGVSGFFSTSSPSLSSQSRRRGLGAAGPLRRGSRPHQLVDLGLGFACLRASGTWTVRVYHLEVNSDSHTLPTVKRQGKSTYGAAVLHC